MKFLVVVLFVVGTNADKLQNTYLPPISAHSAGGNGNFLQAPPSTNYGTPVFKSYSEPFGAPFPAPQVQSSFHNNAIVVPILRLDSDNSGDGNYNFQYETGNHIAHQESGHIRSDLSEVQGSYSYQSPEGETIQVKYVADENGFHPEGSHIPTPPPVPQAILESLQKNAAEEAHGIVDDGSYHEEHSSLSNQYLSPKLGSNFGSPRLNNQYLAPQVNSFASRTSSLNNQYLAPKISTSFGSSSSFGSSTFSASSSFGSRAHVAPKLATPFGGHSSRTSVSNQYLAPKVSNQYLAPKVSNQYLAPKVNNQYLPPDNGGYKY